MKASLFLRTLKDWLKRKLNDGWLPCRVLCRKPMIAVAYDWDFLKYKNEFFTCFRGHGEVHLFLMLGWQHEQMKVAEPFAAGVVQALAEAPYLRITVMTNTPREQKILTELGLNAVFCHQNAFLDEKRYPILPEEKKYDAIYVARITPFKRHLLARKIESLRLIGDYFDGEKDYADEVMQQLGQADWTTFVAAKMIPVELAKAKCGLCLSREEGAMLASCEYLLCGLPVVNTENLGGRDELFPDFAVKNVPDDPDAVAAAVREWAENAPDARTIREAVLAKMRPHRECFRAMLDRVCAEAHEKDPSVPPVFHGRLPHKLGVRCTRMPWDNLLHGLKCPKP